MTADSLRLELAEDRMSARLRVENGHPPGPLAREALLDLAGQAGVVYGLDRELIDRLAKAPKGPAPAFPLEIARGRPAVPGQPARLILCVPEPGPYGALPRPVRKDEVLAVKLEPGPGVDGLDVAGTVLAADPGADLALEVGANVKTRRYPDKREYYAACAGCLAPLAGRLEVVPTYVVERDVDEQLGGLEFEGDLMIRGDVRAGAVVRSGGNLLISGSAIDARLVADGTVRVQGSVVRSRVEAGGDLEAGQTQSSQIRAGGSIVLQAGAYYSTLQAVDTIRTGLTHGSLVGGRLEAGSGIEAGTIGSMLGVPTLIQIGGGPGQASLRPTDQDSLREIQTEMDRLAALLEPWVENGRPAAHLPAHRQWIVARYLRRAEVLGQRRAVLCRPARPPDGPGAEEGRRPPSVRAHHAIYPRVEIRTSTAVLVVEDLLASVQVFPAAGDGRLIVEPLAER